MPEIKDESNPIGIAVQNEAIDLYVDSLIKEWDASKETNIPWYKIWYRVSLNRVTTFLLAALDDLVAYVDDIVEKGADKKATVLLAIGKVYDYVIKEAMPIWLKPFAGYVKDYIINTLISNAIDWMIEKYRNGSWTLVKGENNKVAALWALTEAARRV